MVVSPIASALTTLKVQVRDETSANRANAPKGDHDKQRIGKCVMQILRHSHRFEAVTSITTLLDAYGIWQKAHAQCELRKAVGPRSLG